jgi:hypothetical protein
VVSSLFDGQVTAAAIKAWNRKVDSSVSKNSNNQHHASEMPLAATVKSQMLRLLRRSKSTSGPPARSNRKKGKGSGEHAMVITNKRFSVHVDSPPSSNNAVVATVASKHVETRKHRESGRHSSEARRHSRSQVV